MSEFDTYHTHVREKKEEQIKINGNRMECITMATSCLGGCCSDTKTIHKSRNCFSLLELPYK